MKNTSRIIFYVIGIMAIVGIAFMIIGKMNNGHLINVNIGRDGVKISDGPDFDMDTSDIGLNLIKGSDGENKLAMDEKVGYDAAKVRELTLDLGARRVVVDLKPKKTNNMKQFNLEEYLKDPNKKVVTRDGRNVRIICTDRKGTEYSVVALCTMSNVSEDCYFYFPNGKMYLSSDSCLDLFFAPEKKAGWLNLYEDGNGRVVIGTVFPIESEEIAKMASEDKDYVATCKITWEE